MNNQQRKQLASALAKLGDVVAALEEAQGVVEQLAEDEREKYDNMPESLQQGEKGQAINDAADTLDEIKDSLITALEALEEAAGHDIP